MFEHLKSLVHAAAPAAKPATVSPKPASVAAPAPAVAPVELPAAASAAEAAPEPAPAPVVAARISKEPTIVEYVPEPVVSAPKGKQAFDASGALLGTLMPDGKFIAVDVAADPLASLSAEDKRPIDWDEERRVTLDDGTILPQRRPGRIQFLLTQETEQQTKDRIANDIHRGLAARPRTEFDPEKSGGAQAVNKWKQL